MKSCVYSGTIRHRRFRPVAREFRYRMFMLYLDLDELPRVFDGRWLWSTRRFAPAWFRRADHIGDPSTSLSTSIRNLVAERTGIRPVGPIRLLTHLRYWGYVQNPVSFYYCYDAADARVEYIVADITNTPWGERHAYVVRATPGDRLQRTRFAKAFHVSPFMPMDMDYDWRFTVPGKHLRVHMINLQRGDRVFDATLLMRQEPITGPVLARCLLRHPWMTASVVSGIYAQALRLWIRGAPFHAHPATVATERDAVLSR